MLPKYHVLFSFLFSVGLFLLFPSITLLGVIIIFMAAVLIDVDHYLYYVFKKKNLSLSKAYQFFVDQIGVAKRQKGHYHSPLCIFHTVEALILMIILASYSKIFLYILIGSLLHFVLDLYETFVVYKRHSLRVYTLYPYFKKF